MSDPRRPQRGAPAPTEAPTEAAAEGACPRERGPEAVDGPGALSPLALALDRALPLPVGVQLRGQIEYGIATGEIPRGTRLPSVREMARALELAPATVAQVYKDLREQGLLESQQGRGTFVPERLPPRREPDALVALRRAVDAYFASAAGLGFSRAAAAEAATLQATREPAPERNLRLQFVGIFPDATEAYAEAIRRYVRAADVVEWTTFDAGPPPGPPPDVYVTLANREAELRERVAGAAPVVSLTFLPSRGTRTRLAALPPDARVAVVASIPEFLPTLLRNVTRYCPHVSHVEAAPLAGGALSSVLAWCTAVVYATGTRDVLARVPSSIEAFEFRYEPDVGSITQLLLPTLEGVREERAQEE